MLRRSRRFLIAALFIFCSNPVYAWGDKGHQVIAFIAWHHLSPTTREQIDALLKGDDSGLTATDFVNQSVWADEYRDSDRNATLPHRGSSHHKPSHHKPSQHKQSPYEQSPRDQGPHEQSLHEKSRYEQTRRWHYINLKITHPDFSKACYGSPRLKPQQPASSGPSKACITDKVEQFVAELGSPRTPVLERRLALQFLIHLVGDLHQPLHVGDNDDAGGNEINVSAKGFKRGTLHRYWDSAIVGTLGRKPETIARRLIEQMGQTPQRWQHGNPRDWTMETFGVARDIAYAQLPTPNAAGIHILDDHYIDSSKNSAAQQLTKAGLRLAALLETAFATQPTQRRSR